MTRDPKTSGRKSGIFDFESWKKLWSVLDAKERRDAVGVLMLAIVAAGTSALMVGSIMPFLTVISDPSTIHTVPLMSRAYSALGVESDFVFLVWLGIASIVVILIAMAIQLWRIHAVAHFGMTRIHSLSCRLLVSYFGQDYEYFLSQNSGGLSTKVLAEAQEVVTRFLYPATELLTALISVVVIVIFLFWIDPLITLSTIAALGLIYALTYGATRYRLKRLGEQRATNNSERFRIVNEAFGGIKDVKLLGAERRYLERFSVPSRLMADALAQVQVLSQTPFHFIQTVALAGVVALCLVIVDPAAFSEGAALNGVLPLLGVFAFGGQRLMPELGRLYRNAATIQFGRAAIDAIYDDLRAMKAGELPSEDSIHATGLKRELRLDDVSYRYPSSESAGITDVSITIRKGERIGVVGGTGAGKTTLGDVILGLLVPHSGALIADGQPVTDDTRRQWRRTIGYVPQDIFLADASVAENIAMGVAREKIDHEAVKRAALAARIDEFVCSELPDGYDTGVGERGVRLSGGQKQRIGIARALYRDADLILFDEATSALDNSTEAEVIAAIDALSGEKTVIMIAHRLTTVQHCDRLVVMENGRIVGCDTWDKLMRDNPAFQRIAKLAPAS